MLPTSKHMRNNVYNIAWVASDYEYDNAINSNDKLNVLLDIGFVGIIFFTSG